MRQIKSELLGYFHGEGAIIISIHANKNARYGLTTSEVATVNSEDLDILEKLKEVYGGSICYNKVSGYDKGKGKRLPCWTIKGDELKAFLTDLVATKIKSKKSQQARLLLKAIKIKEKSPLPYLMREELLKIAKIAEQISSLAKKGKRKWTFTKVKTFLGNQAEPASPYWTKKEIEEFRRLYPTTPTDEVLLKLFPNKSRHSLYEKASVMGLKKQNIPKRPRCPACNHFWNKKQCLVCGYTTGTSITPRPHQNSQALKKLYWEEKKSLSEIAEMFNVNAHTIRYWMNKFKIPRRLRLEGLRLKIQTTNTFS